MAHKQLQYYMALSRSHRCGDIVEASKELEQMHSKFVTSRGKTYTDYRVPPMNQTAIIQALLLTYHRMEQSDKFNRLKHLYPFLPIYIIPDKPMERNPKDSRASSFNSADYGNPGKARRAVILCAVVTFISGIVAAVSSPK